MSGYGTRRPPKPGQFTVFYDVDGDLGSDVGLHTAPFNSDGTAGFLGRLDDCCGAHGFGHAQVDNFRFDVVPCRSL